MSKQKSRSILLALILTLILAAVVSAQSEPTLPSRLEIRVAQLEKQVGDLEQRITQLETLLGVDSANSESHSASEHANTPTPTRTVEAKVASTATPTPVSTDPLDNMRAERDNVLQRKLYFDVSMPAQQEPVNQFYIYIADDGVKPTLRWQVQFSGSDWLFMDRLLINVDGVLSELRFPEQPFREVLEGGTVKEWINMPVASDELELLKAMIESDATIVRFAGDAHYSDAWLSVTHKQAMKNVLAAFEELGGQNVPVGFIRSQSTKYIEQEIVGTWQAVDTNHSIQFNADGTWLQVYKPMRDYSGTYEILEGGIISYTIEQPADMASQVSDRVYVSGDTLYIVNDKLAPPLEFRRK